MSESNPNSLETMEKIFGTNPVKPLFHYTSLKGLRGIAESKSIWATDARFLNDRSEIEYIADITDGIIEYRLLSEKGNKADLRQLSDTLRLWRRTHSRAGAIYVCSLSEQGNQLSQWRGYCAGGGGVSVGFDSVELHNSMVRRGVITVKVSYDRAEQEIVVNEILDHVLYGDISPVYQDAPRMESAKDVFVEMLAFVAPVLKHPAFHEEVEWRLAYSRQYRGVFSSLSANHPSIFPAPIPNLETRYREGHQILVPYVAFPLAEGENPLQLHSVITGPSENEELFLETVSGYLKFVGVEVEHYLRSGIPLRTL
jgi:hypothetical protein